MNTVKSYFPCIDQGVLQKKYLILYLNEHESDNIFIDSKNSKTCGPSKQVRNPEIK